MAWNNPKKNWKAGDTPNSGDFNRIEENIDILGRLDRTSAYGVAIGTNAYAVTLDPAPLTYYEGMCIAVKITSQNTGSSTINVNGLGAKSIRKQNGNLVSAGNLKAGIIYTMRYNGTNFYLQGEGGEGTAQSGDVIIGKTFTNDSGTFTGTLKRRAHGEIVKPLYRTLARPDNPDWGYEYVTNGFSVNLGWQPSIIFAIYRVKVDSSWFRVEGYTAYNRNIIKDTRYVYEGEIRTEDSYVGQGLYSVLKPTSTGFTTDDGVKGLRFPDRSDYNSPINMYMYYTAIE